MTPERATLEEREKWWHRLSIGLIVTAAVLSSVVPAPYWPLAFMSATAGAWLCHRQSMAILDEIIAGDWTIALASHARPA